MYKGIDCYFGASNSFRGFVSYFDSVFNPKKYEKIYILKGGPGTGKSSFMKEILSFFSAKQAKCEAIFCSSDPDSLDGIIIENDNKKIAIIDGTSPHTTDPVLPGAVDKILNLGDFWNSTLLKNNIDKIKELSDCKKQYYKNAYEFLSIANACTETVDKEICELFTNDYINEIKDIFAPLKDGGGTTEIKLKGSFGKHGFYEIENNILNVKKEIRIVGIYGSEYMFMDCALNEANRKAIDLRLSPSPLDKNKFDSMFLKEEGILICAKCKKACDFNSTVIDTSKYLDTKKLNRYKTKFETLYKERELFLWCAADEFKKAAETHSEMEKIYVASMDFKKVKRLISKTKAEIQDFLFQESDMQQESI